MPVLAALEACWILAVFILLFCGVPAHLFSGRPLSDAVMRTAGNAARMVLAVTIALPLLASLKLLSAVTVIFLVAGLLSLNWLRMRAHLPGGLLISLQAAAIDMVRKIEARASGFYRLPQRRPRVSTSSFWGFRINRWLGEVEGKELLVACFAVVLTMAVILHAVHAVRELRFDQPEQYSVLLRARELMLNLHPARRPIVFPALIAATSFLSGANATQVTRFLSPVVEVLVVLAAALLMQACTRFGVASVAVLYCLGAAALPPAGSDAVVATSILQKVENVLGSSSARMQPNAEFGIALLFLLLALAILADWHRNKRGWDSLLDFVCCLVLTGIISQFLLLVLMITAGVLLLRPMAGLVGFVLLSYGFAAYVILSGSIKAPDGMGALLSVAAAILVGCLLTLIENKLLARGGRAAQTLLLAACLGATVIWLKPQRLLGQYLEYDAAARTTQEIASTFPRQTWAVVAPVEQLAETLGSGAYEDLGRFVEKYNGQIMGPQFRYQEVQQDLFIYVEKRPFQIFSREPESVPFSVLADPTYRNYRSPGGRASLEAAALQLCENYRQHHSDVDVFFENEDLRIYHVHQQRLRETQSRK